MKIFSLANNEHAYLEVTEFYIITKHKQILPGSEWKQVK